MKQKIIREMIDDLSAIDPFFANKDEQKVKTLASYFNLRGSIGNEPYLIVIPHRDWLDTDFNKRVQKYIRENAPAVAFSQAVVFNESHSGNDGKPREGRTIYCCADKTQAEWIATMLRDHFGVAAYDAEVTDLDESKWTFTPHAAAPKPEL